MVVRSVRVLAAVLAVLMLVVAGVTAVPGVAMAVQGLPTRTTSPATVDTAGVSSASPDAGGVEKGRLGGADRVATSVEISKAAFPEGSQVVYLARRDILADALASGMLTDGPVLLVPSCRGVPSVVTGEIARLDPAKVVALGGEGAVCQDSLDQAAQGREADRLAGKNRYQTAVAISQYVFPAGPVAEVYIANAADSPDAVAGGVLTAGPVLLVPNERATPSVVTAEIERLAPRRVVALGGPIALDEGTLTDAAGGRAMDRLAGENRYETAVAVGSFQFNGPAPVAYVARGDVFVDAVAAGVLTDGPVFLLSATCGEVPPAVRQALGELAPTTVVALGGQSAVCEASLDAALAAVPVSETPVVVAPGLEVLTDQELTQVESFDPQTGTIVLGGGAPTVAAISEGDVVVAGYSEAVPQGFLRRVEAVSLPDDGFVLATSEASLPEAVAHTNGLVGGEPVLLASYVEPAEGVEVVDGIVPQGQRAIQPEALAPDAVEVNLEHTLALNRSFSATTGGANFTGSGSVDLDARVTVGGTLTADADIGWFTLKELLLKAGPTAKASAGATVSGSLKGEANPALGKVTRFWTFPVGPVPVVLVETADLSINATLSTDTSLSVSTGIEASSVVGVHYKDGALKPLLESSGTATAPQATGTAAGSVGLDVGPAVQIKAYGIAGLKGKTGPWAQASFTSDETNPLSCRLEAGLRASLAAVAGIDILGLKAQIEKRHEETLTLFDEEVCEPPTDDVVGDGVTVINEDLTGSPNQWGKVDGFVPGESTWVLSTGLIQDTVGAPSFFASTELGTTGDAELSALAGAPTYDAVAFSVTVVPDGETLNVRYAFASEEYPEYVGSLYNDVMAVLVDGTNCALVPGTTTPVAINTVNHLTNSELYVDNSTGAAGYGTTMDGLTTPLTCSRAVTPGVPVTIKIVVADTSDAVYDSAVALLDGGIWSE